MLAHTRKAMFNKTMILSSQIWHHVYLQKYEPSLGGRFPVALFQNILERMNWYVGGGVVLVFYDFFEGFNTHRSILEYISLLPLATQLLVRRQSGSHTTSARQRPQVGRRSVAFDRPYQRHRGANPIRALGASCCCFDRPPSPAT